MKRFVVSLKSGLTFATPWTVAQRAPLSTAFPRQEYWSGLPFSAPGDLPHPKIEVESPALAGGFFTTEPPGKSISSLSACSVVKMEIKPTSYNFCEVLV